MLEIHCAVLCLLFYALRVYRLRSIGARRLSFSQARFRGVTLVNNKEKMCRHVQLDMDIIHLLRDTVISM